MLYDSGPGEMLGALITGSPLPQPQPHPLDCITGAHELQGLDDSHGLQELQRFLRNICNIPPPPTPQHSQPAALHVMSAKAVRIRSLFMAEISV
ncbi:MAG TPA: hypothetical protein VG056_17575 [Pirellulales bacterium]|jgi:hypothetical protein|nr:hypothetical protein [Pirellulales bacterium]